MNVVRDAIAATPAIFDPLLQTLDLPLSLEVFPLGFPVRIATNSAEVVRAARDSWDTFPCAFPTEPIQLRIAVSEEAAPGPLAPPAYRGQGQLLSIVLDAANFAVCDLRRGFGFCWLSEAALRDPDYVRYFFLETMVYTTLNVQHLTSVHAACVALEGSGVLLCGHSGAGKSCLAYACARRGFAFVSDDVTSLLRRDPEPVVVGKPTRIRFRGSAGELLPELDGLLVTAAANGKPTIEVRTADLSGFTTASKCRVQCIVFLDRDGSSQARLIPVSKDDARRRIQAEIPFLDRESYDEQLASLDTLLKVGTFELQYSDLGSAEALIKSLLRNGG